jgi:hypothetical protein
LIQIILRNYSGGGNLHYLYGGFGEFYKTTNIMAIIG